MSKLFTAFQNQVARLAAKGATPSDTKRIVRFATESACAAAECAIDANVVASMTNQKALMRLSQALNFVVSGDVAAFDTASAFVIAALALSKQERISFSDMHYLIGASGNENTAHIKGVSRSKMQKILSSISSMGTITSQVSRTVGSGGYLTALGVVTKSDKHGFTIANRSHPMIVAYAAQLEKMTDGALHLALNK